MKYLFDANSIALILARKRDEAINILAGESTIDLTLYKLGNVVLGESRSKRWTEDKSSIIVGYAEKVLSVMDVERIQLGDMQAIQRNAVKLSISFYDSALLTYAKVMNRTLVTEDEQLARAAKVLKVVCLGVKEMDISSCSCIS